MTVKLSDVIYDFQGLAEWDDKRNYKKLRKLLKKAYVKAFDKGDDDYAVLISITLDLLKAAINA